MLYDSIVTIKIVMVTMKRVTKMIIMMTMLMMIKINYRYNPF